MADITTFNSSMHQNHLLSITLCKYPSLIFPSSSHFLTFSPPKHTPFLEFRAHVSSTRTSNLRLNKENTGRSKIVGSVVEEQIEKNHLKGRRNKVVNGGMEKNMRKNGDNDVKKEKIVKKSKRKKDEPPEMRIRMELDKCCKKGDVMAALQLYDLAQKKGVKLVQYHYTLLLYLCSSAAAGVVQPAKSGRSARTLGSFEASNEASSTNVVDFSELVDECDRNLSFVEANSQIFSNLNKLIDSGRNTESKDHMKMDSSSRCDDGNEILVSEDVKKYALERGFELYEKMCKDKIPTNEATLTSVARMAMSMGYGDMAFDMVKQMEVLGISPRLRSYSPALSVFCNSGDVDKAFAVEQHMLKNGVCPEEPELEALLRVSVEAGKGDKVYYLLHKLRTMARKVSPSTASVIVGWFKSKAAARVGKTKWDKNVVKEAIENGGGGWHGQGWLGKGKWTVSCTSIGADAFCKSCGEKLATIDLDPKETDNFAESVASIAIKREKDSSFQKFQKWLDYYGPFEALIDGANVGLISQNKFTPMKINAVANGIRQKLPSKKWPLIVLHNKRVTGPKMNEPVNKSLVEKWKNADALYATPTGSNDDWYWLYAAIKFKCLLVTNDEMRDHTFQLLGNDFFPKWKERHQVHFDFDETGPVFHMPPCFSVIIQESEDGHWHIPITTDHNNEQERAWLCIRRTKSAAATEDSITNEPEDSQSVDHSDQRVRLTGKTRVKAKKDAPNKSHKDTSHQQVYKNLKNILSESGFAESPTVVSEIEAAEKLGHCVIDFQI